MTLPPADRTQRTGFPAPRGQWFVGIILIAILLTLTFRVLRPSQGDVRHSTSSAIPSDAPESAADLVQVGRTDGTVTNEGITPDWRRREITINETEKRLRKELLDFVYDKGPVEGYGLALEWAGNSGQGLEDRIKQLIAIRALPGLATAAGGEALARSAEARLIDFLADSRPPDIRG